MNARNQTILHIVGARPNFMKAASVYRSLSNRPEVSQRLVHTGQHYDPAMSQIFFDQLELPVADVNLDVRSGSHARQTANIMIMLETLFLGSRPDRVLVYGDVNSTVAAALVCAKLGIPVAHVEAGLRSGDRTMPEEINRLITDQIADLLLTPSADGDANLLREGIAPAKIHCVGTVMIDTLVRLLPKAKQLIGPLRAKLGAMGDYGLVTLHRPSNADDSVKLSSILSALDEISRDLPLVFPVHPRTHRQIADLKLAGSPTLRLIEPLGYLEFLALQSAARVVITDSGGVQEETTYLGVPCLTLRKNTERPITVDQGTNLLLGDDLNLLRETVTQILAGGFKEGKVPELWDGHASERIADILCR